MTKLSIVMCNYNHENFLSESIEAILSQSYVDFELIVIEDSSTDNSLEVLKMYSAKDERIKIFVNEHNIGVLLSGNRGLRHAKGEYIYFAASDDRICKDFFKKTISLLEMHQEAGICSGLIHLIDEDGKNKGWMRSPIISRVDCYINPKDASEKFRSIGPWFAGQTVVYKKKCFTDLNLMFNPDLKHRADHFVNFVIAAKFGACFYPEVKATYRLMDTGFAETVFANEELSRKTLHLLIEMLRDEKYKSFLSSKTVDAIARRSLHEIEIREINKMMSQNIALLDRLVLAGKTHNLIKNNFPIFLLKKINFMYYFLLKIYIFIKRMDGQIEWLFNRYKQYSYNKFYNKNFFSQQ